MRRLAVVVTFLLAPAFAADDSKPPEWAYPVNPPDFKLAPDDGTPRRVPDSSASYTLTQSRSGKFGLVLSDLGRLCAA